VKEELHAIAPTGLMGRVIWDRTPDRLRFIYEEEWRRAGGSYPLSLSMPLAAAEHPHRVIAPFLWGLLPDNDGILQRWGKRYHVSPRHPFQLLKHVGEECAGAVQLVQSDRAAEWRSGRDAGSVEWLEPGDIIERMRLLLIDHGNSRLGSDIGQFSLAGAQPKTAYLYDSEGHRWGIPSGRIPTTHIFKPSTGAFDGFAENEHFCMQMARMFEMPVASSTIRMFGNIPTIVVRRYDRVGEGLNILRIHQEDMCQSLARYPYAKYQNEGGPSPREVINLIRESSSGAMEDVTRFVDAMIFNWLIWGSDAHAKNYSFLIGHDQVRLAPLYDLVSALPYPDKIPIRKARLAMKIGHEYKLRAIDIKQWRHFAEEMRLDFDFVRDRISRIIKAAPNVARAVGEEVGRELPHPIIPSLVERVIDRARVCEAAMEEAI
jgi:serine/threonine-protein kinase HipA